ncbi:MAG: cryptochrome/photolyase family protein [Bacteroidales bacterium]|nr:cryptochrome/photolyase family protein [Bacteroidales bacterium]
MTQNGNARKIRSISLVFPHQLFEKNPCIDKQRIIYIVEEYLYFRQYKFHKQKIAFHRASMKFYENHLRHKGYEVVYIDSFSELSDIRNLIPYLAKQGTREIYFCELSDNWLEQRIKNRCESTNINLHEFDSTLFVNAKKDLETYFSRKNRLYQTDFYKHQRKTRNILMEKDQKPLGGKWTYDDENRLKYPKGKTPPKVDFAESNDYYAEAADYTQKYFPENYGILNAEFIYPTTFSASKAWLQHFFKTRFSEFGAYEDAIVLKETILHHSVLTPVLNAGLITPRFVIDETLQYAGNHQIPLNSLEGFIRQIVGWREFIRAVYELKGNEERTMNYWGFTRKIPASFWNGTTGIEPVDLTIKKVLTTGYCHHIERLMVLGNFMLLCEFDPDEVYRWFMELFIDAYDWVMVPNVYGMSQFADGGLMASKPYISGSNYLMKMSDYGKGAWQAVWDGLFWRFLHTHRGFFLQNPRLGMLVKTFDKMPEQKQKTHLNNATHFLESLSS